MILGGFVSFDGDAMGTMGSPLRRLRQQPVRAPRLRRRDVAGAAQFVRDDRLAHLKIPAPSNRSVRTTSSND
jgi:hypothetical protein